MFILKYCTSDHFLFYLHSEMNLSGYWCSSDLVPEHICSWGHSPGSGAHISALVFHRIQHHAWKKYCHGVTGSTLHCVQISGWRISCRTHYTYKHVAWIQYNWYSIYMITGIKGNQICVILLIISIFTPRWLGILRSSVWLEAWDLYSVCLLQVSVSNSVAMPAFLREPQPVNVHNSTELSFTSLFGHLCHSRLYKHARGNFWREGRMPSLWLQCNMENSALWG